MDGHPATLTFGAPQGTDVRPICREDLAGTGQPLSYQAVANYIAKYTTKTLSVPGLPSLRIRRETDIGQLRCPTHYRQMITTAWHAGPRFRAWAHMLGYGGHFLTKSRRYSVTFGQLRTARADHRRTSRPPPLTATPGTARSTKPSSWSCPPPGPTPESGTP